MENKKKKPIVRSKFDTVRVKTKVKGKTMTKQEFKQECDINHLMSRYQETGTLPDVAMKGAGIFGDFTIIEDFKDAQDAVIKAREVFEGLPSNIRARFGNDPAALVEFMNDPKANYQEGIALGLFETKETIQARKEQQALKKADQEKAAEEAGAQ